MLCFQSSVSTRKCNTTSSLFRFMISCVQINQFSSDDKVRDGLQQGVVPVDGMNNEYFAGWNLNAFVQKDTLCMAKWCTLTYASINKNPIA